MVKRWLQKASDPKVLSRTWADYLAELGTLPSDTSWAEMDPEWDGRAGSLAGAINIVRNGWSEWEDIANLSASAEKACADAYAASASALREIAWDVTGSAYDVGEYLAGNPECWIDFPECPSKPKARIYVNIATSGGVPAAAIKMRGGAVCGLVQSLTATGHAVEVYQVSGGSCSTSNGVNDGSVRWLRVALNDFDGGPLDKNRLAFAMAHPASLRQLDLSYVGNMVPTDRDFPWRSECDLYLPCMHADRTNWNNQGDVIDWVVDSFNKLTAAR